ncbi:MAG: hypothetical protein JWM80_2069 [Cyanobacteria bacterium RYN_339]|nr:hypothetical protein [Cyanobacteria bacterium RYN_339]
MTTAKDSAQLIKDAMGLLQELEATIGQAKPIQTEQSSLLGSLCAFSRDVLALDDVTAIVERAVDAPIQLGLARQVFLGIKDANGAPLERFASAVPGNTEKIEARGIARAALARVVAWQEPLFVPDVSSDEQLWADVETYGVPVDGVICLPLKLDGEITGGLYLDRGPEDARFSQQDFELASYLGDLLARALGMSLREQGRAKREEHLASLFGLARDVASAKDLDAMLDHVAHATLEITGAERAFILLLEGDQLQFGVGRDREQALTSQTFKQLSHSVCQKVIESQEQVCVFDAASDHEFGLRRSVVNLQLQGIVAVPLFGRQGLTGVLYIDSKTKALAALRKEMTVLTAIASVASLMIDNTRLYHRATVDGATGLFSRSLLMIRLEEEVSRARRYKRPFSLVMVDLDARDGAEQPEGLKRVAQIVRLQLRAGIDFPSLYSDDRVAMILPETDAEGALVVAERIREKVAGTDAAQTVSISIAAFPAAATSMHGLIDAAERAIASARQQGKNRTIVGIAT